jgi:hypothetical protein
VSLLDRIRFCQRRDMRRFRPFRVGATRVGWVRHDFAERLATFADTFVVAADSVELAPALDSFDKRSAAVDRVLRRLRAEGLFPGWREEAYPVTTAFHVPPLLQIERSATPPFGILAFSVHLVGYVSAGDDMQLWVAQRARHKPVEPGKLDLLANGGQPIDIGLRDNLVKEAAEEASLPAHLAWLARPAGAVAYGFEDAVGLHDEINFLFDLPLPPDFVPQNSDGEVEAFFLWPATRVIRELAETDHFAYDAALGFIDFLVRQGCITPEEPDYLAILHGLRGRPEASG